MFGVPNRESRGLSFLTLSSLPPLTNLLSFMCAFASPHHHTFMLSHVAKGQAHPVLIVTIFLLSHVAKGQAISVLIITLSLPDPGYRGTSQCSPHHHIFLAEPGH